MRKSGNKVRITAQLIKAADGYHLWSETYDRTLDDIFVVQDDIAGEVVKALKLTLLGTALATRSKPRDPEAYNLALQGRFFSTGAARGPRALDRLLPAVAGARSRLRPGLGGPVAGIRTAGRLGFVPVADGFRRAREAAEKALALDPQLVDAHLAMGWIQHALRLGLGGRGRQLSQSTRPGTRQRPGPQARRRPGADLGRWRRSDRPDEQGHRARSAAAEPYSNLGLALLAVNRDTEAEAAFRKALELDPGGAFGICRSGGPCSCRARPKPPCRKCSRKRTRVWRLSGLPLAFHALGRRGESDAALAALKEKYAEDSAYQIAEVHAFRGEADLAFEWLERAYDQRDGGVRNQGRPADARARRRSALQGVSEEAEAAE